MNNRDKLKTLIVDVFLLETADFRFDLRREEVEAWDSLGIVSLAVGLQETFGYHLTPEEAMSIESVSRIMEILSSKGVRFDD